jgi:hypothetical protein
MPGVYLAKTPICLPNFKKTWINVNYLSESSDEFWRKKGADGYISVCWPCSLVGKSLVSGASVEMKIKFASSNPDVCIFFFLWLCCIRKTTKKILHLYIIQLYAAYTKYDLVC